MYHRLRGTPIPKTLRGDATKIQFGHPNADETPGVARMRRGIDILRAAARRVFSIRQDHASLFTSAVLPEGFQ